MVDAFSRDNLFQENKFERSSVRLRRVVVNGHSFLGLALDFSNFAVAVAKWAKRTLNSRFCPCATMVTNGYWSSMCAQLPRFLIYFFSFFFFFFFYMRIGNLESSCKFQRASRLKKEDRRGPTHCHEEGCNEWFLIFWIFYRCKEWEIIVTTLSLCSF